MITNSKEFNIKMQDKTVRNIKKIEIKSYFNERI